MRYLPYINTIRIFDFMANSATIAGMRTRARIKLEGVVQGIGQALMEHVRYDESGQPITGSLMDYALPRAEDVPNMTVGDHPVPATTNPLGSKGCGEAGCAGSLSTVVNAVIDALSEYGIKHIDMPLTPERIWRAIQEAKAKAA